MIQRYHAVKCNPELRRRWIVPEVYDGTECQTVQPDIFSLGELTRFSAKRRSIDNLKSIIDQYTNVRPHHRPDLSGVRKCLKMYM